MERRTFLKGIAAGSALAVTSATALTSVVQADDDIIHRLVNRANPSTMEKKHVPAIEAPASVKKDVWFKVKVKVGYLIEHPSTRQHWIEEIKLMVDQFEIAQTEFEVGGFCAPYAEFTVRLSHDTILRAEAECNLHGTWESEPFHIKVT